MFRSAFRALTTLRLRNDLRLRLGQHPIELRERYPDLAELSLQRGAVVFDVGANVGYFSESVLAHQPWARIHAFEPLADACAKLRGALAPFGDGIVINATALGAARGERAFRVSRFDEASSFLENGAVLNDRVYGIDFTTVATIPVTIDTIADYIVEHCIPRIDLLKLDVQGFELEALRGAEPALDRIEAIYCEAQFEELYRGGPLAGEIFAWLHARGFELLRMTAFRADDKGRLMECDMIFRRRTA
jgi:FkbM family methyltransferase